MKFYSSGMKVRLGFAVAAFLEPQILIVDEVLAVGDSSFQQKCLDRMRQVIQSGTTLLLVSHDLATVGATATRGIWLADGTVQADGPIDQTLAGYRRAIEARAEANADVKGLVRVSDVSVEGTDGRLVTVAEDCTIRLSVETDQDRSTMLYLGVTEGAATPIFVVAARGDPEGGSHRPPDRRRPPPAPAPPVLPVVRRVREGHEGRAHGVAAGRPVHRVRAGCGSTRCRGPSSGSRRSSWPPAGPRSE